MSVDDNLTCTYPEQPLEEWWLRDFKALLQAKTMVSELRWIDCVLGRLQELARDFHSDRRHTGMATTAPNFRAGGVAFRTPTSIRCGELSHQIYCSVVYVRYCSSGGSSWRHMPCKGALECQCGRWVLTPKASLSAPRTFTRSQVVEIIFQCFRKPSKLMASEEQKSGPRPLILVYVLADHSASPGQIWKDVLDVNVVYLYRIPKSTSCNLERSFLHAHAASK